MFNQAHDSINKEKDPQFISLLDIQVGDICKFKGTRGKGRNKGLRRIMEMNTTTFFCRVVEFKDNQVTFTNFTSTNTKDKLVKVLRNGHWVRVIQ